MSLCVVGEIDKGLEFIVIVSNGVVWKYSSLCGALGIVL